MNNDHLSTTVSGVVILQRLEFVYAVKNDIAQLHLNLFPTKSRFSIAKTFFCRSEMLTKVRQLRETSARLHTDLRHQNESLQSSSRFESTLNE